MTHRITLLLDDETWAAAHALARQYGVTVSEAIRRSVIRKRDLTVVVPAKRRAQRTRDLRRAFELFEDNDPAGEVRRLKEQDAGS